MRADFLKIAGVKSEAEFYKKFPSEEAFMKKHGKAVKKLMAKRAQVGTMIPNIGTPEQNLTPISFDNDYMNDSVAKLTGGKTSQELRDDAMYQAKMADLNKPEKPGFMEQITNIAQGAFSGMNNSAKNGGKFEPHMMYDPKTKKGKKAKTLKEHLALKKKGWGHTAPKAQEGGVDIGTPQFDFDLGDGGPSRMGRYNADGSPETFGQGAQRIFESNEFQTGLSIVDDAISISDQIKSQKENLAQVKQNRKVAEIALQASKTMPEKIERKYVRPEDIQNTGEEFFPIYGVGTNVLAKSGININPKNEGKFTAWAKKRGMSVAEAADKVMANKSKYSKEVVKMANFAKNARSFNKAQDGGMFNGEYMPLTNPNQQKQFKGGGFVYGGGPAGQAGIQFAGMLGVNDDAGSNIGGKVGSTAGMAIGGPVGAFIGGALGSGVGDLLDRNDRRVRIEQDKLARINKEMAYGSIAPSIQAGYASHVKNGGKIESMRSGGHMRGNYIPPNPSALDTMKMGGELKTLWGGEAETVSYNPYAGGESIQFKGNSHSYRDPKTGQTGIGVAYGENAVNNNEPSVEVENEPAQKLRDGGGDENLVVFGDMYIPGTNKKFKNYVSNVLNPKEAKINKRQEKVANLGLESDDTVFGQLERNTADTVLKGSDMKLKAIADKKNMLADLQSALNDTFDEYGIDANEFLKKGKMVKDPMRIENSQVSKYGNNVPKAQNGPPDKLKTNELPDEPKVFDSAEEAEKAGFSYNEEKDRWEKETSKGTESAELSIEALEEVRKGQSKNKETGLFGNVTIEQFEESKKANPWFDWENFDPNNEADVKRYQNEFNKRAEEAGDPTRLQIDGRFGEQTASARFSQAQEATSPEYEVATITEPEELLEENVVQPQIPMLNFQRPIDDESLDANQLLGEYYAMATNQVQPVQAQGFQPRLRTPYDISLQAQKNQVISQQRALMRNPILQNNPAAAAMVSAQSSDQLQKINENEFIANQQMKDAVYSGNLEAINQAKLTNLGIFDEQADRQAQAAANTRRQNIEILSSISNKYAQNKRDNIMRKVYANMYPTYRYDRNFQTQVQQPTVFNTGQTNTGGIGPFISGGGFGGGQTMQQLPGIIGGLQSIFGNQGQSNEEESEPAKYGKKVTKNNKNSNILKAIRNL
jgi:hypothetical protein